MSTVYLGLGSNMGDKEGSIKKAISLLSDLGVVVKASKLYLTEPVGFKDQEWFLNIIVLLETDLDPYRLLDAVQSIEKSMGRVRVRRYEPRVIDIDILFYDDLVIDDESLTIPHPRLHERRFILEAMLDLNPCLKHPVNGKTIEELYHECRDHSMVKPYDN
jgi:2-amino-4-hydroxy-6-hydroxymethyldihydropteridine diphosphokinase